MRQYALLPNRVELSSLVGTICRWYTKGDQEGGDSQKRKHSSHCLIKRR